MPEKHLTTRIKEALQYSLGLGLEETLLIVTTDTMLPVSTELCRAKLGDDYHLEDSYNLGNHQVKIYKNEEGIAVVELLLQGERPFKTDETRVFDELLDLFQDIRGVVGLYNSVKGMEEVSFRIAAKNTFQTRPLRYAHIPGTDAKTTLEGWDKLLPDNIQEMTEKAELGKAHFAQEGLIGLHFVGQNGTDYVHFINGRTRWNNDITCDFLPGRIGGVQWPCGELYDENEIEDKRVPRGERLEIRRGYGIWVGDMSIGNLQEEDGTSLELRPRRAKATVYVGMDGKGCISHDEIGLMTQIVVEESGQTVFLSRGAIEKRAYQPGASRVANEIYRVFTSVADDVSAAVEPIYVQEIAAGFNDAADPRAKELIEGEKAAPHGAIGTITTHMDFVTDPRGIVIDALVLKEEYRCRINDAAFVEGILKDQSSWQKYLEVRQIYQDGSFAQI